MIVARDKRSVDGFWWRCSVRNAELSRQWQRRNREKVAAQQWAYEQRNRQDRPRRHSPWTEEEDRIILEHVGSGVDLAEKLSRPLRGVYHRRNKRRQLEPIKEPEVVPLLGVTRAQLWRGFS